MEQSISNKRENFNAVDIARFVMSFFVISIHTCYTFFDNIIIDSIIGSVIIRLAVPFFLVASGFFFFRDIVFENGRIKKCPENRARLCKFLKRNILLYSIWAIIYFVCEACVYLDMNISPLSLLKSYMVQFFTAGISLQFWYLTFLIYAVILLYFLLRFLKTEIVGAIVAVFFILFFYGHTYIEVIDTAFLENFVESAFYIKGTFLGGTINLYKLYIALGFVFAGLMCVRLRERLSMKISAIFTMVSLGVLVAENIIIRIFWYQGRITYLFFLLPTVLFGFIFLSKVRLNGSRKVFSFMRNSSSFIYCSHMLIFMIFNHFTGRRFVDAPLSFLVVSLLSFMASLIVVPLSRKVKFLRRLY